MRRPAASGSVRGAAVLAVGAAAALLLAAGSAWWGWAARPSRDGAAAVRAGRWAEALTLVQPGLERPGFDGAEHEVTACALLGLGRAAEAAPHLDAVGGPVAERKRAVPPEPLAEALLAAGRERELGLLTAYVARTSEAAPTPSLRAHAAFAAHAAGDLHAARPAYAALLAEPGLAAPLRAVVEAQARRAEAEARDRRVTVAVAHDGTPLAWRVPGTADVVAGPELSALTRGAPVADLPGLSADDLDGQVVLALDPALQRRAAEVFRAERGALVVLDPLTGDVLAAAADEQAAPLAALTALFEPGSTLKAATMAAWLESGLPLDRLVPHECRGNDFVLEGGILHDWARHGTVDSLERALAVSCNTVFAKVALGLGAERLRAALAPLGMDDGRVALAGGAEVAGGTLPSGPLTPTRLARAGMGLDETRVTALQAALLATALAEGGRLRAPRLVVERRNVIGQPIEPPRPAETIALFTPEATAAVVAAMREVVEQPDGTGRGARRAGVSVALKTGTTGGDGEPLNAAFVGFAPLERPRLAFSLFTLGSGRSLDVSRRVLGPWLEDVFGERALTGGGSG